MTAAIESDVYEVKAMLERIDDLLVRGKPTQTSTFKIIMRSSTRKISVVQHEPFVGLVVGDSVEVTFRKRGARNEADE